MDAPTPPDLAQEVQLPHPPLQTPQHIPPPPPQPFHSEHCHLIIQGAEALLYRTHFLTPSTPAALKVRPSKPYRHEILDRRLTRQRVLAEARVLVKLSALRGGEGCEVRVPGVLGVEWDVARRIKGLEEGVRGRTGVVGEGEGEAGSERGGGAGGGRGSAWLLIEWIEGKCVKDLLREWDLWYKRGDVGEEEKEMGEEEVKRLLRRVGRAVGAMHSRGGVVHGDLTSSNIMVKPLERQVNGGDGYGDASANGMEDEQGTQSKEPDLSGEIVLIDFGLATQSIQDEDRAVDLYVLERAFGSTHPRQEGRFDREVLQSDEGYRGSFGGSAVVLRRLEEVRLRGRKRSMVG